MDTEVCVGVVARLVRLVAFRRDFAVCTRPIGDGLLLECPRGQYSTCSLGEDVYLDEAAANNTPLRRGVPVAYREFQPTVTANKREGLARGNVREGTGETTDNKCVAAHEKSISCSR